MKLITLLPPWLKNKYIISLLAFTAWLLFFDRNDIITQVQRRHELAGLQRSKAYYTNQVATQRKELQQLSNDPAILEKYAREKYYMKRDNEELFIIPEHEAKQGN
jgi:cell division protein FtsB